MPAPVRKPLTAEEKRVISADITTLSRAERAIRDRAKMRMRMRERRKGQREAIEHHLTTAEMPVLPAPNAEALKQAASIKIVMSTIVAASEYLQREATPEGLWLSGSLANAAAFIKTLTERR